MLKIKKNVPIAKEEKDRKVWPFSKMKIGDVVDVINTDEWHEAVKYAHVIAGKKDWKMKGTWFGGKNMGRIRRIS